MGFHWINNQVWRETIAVNEAEDGNYFLPSSDSTGTNHSWESKGHVDWSLFRFKPVSQDGIMAVTHDRQFSRLMFHYQALN